MQTERRRLIQPLWSALDAHVAPHAARGLLSCVSGGPDSRALLEALARWQGRFLGRVLVACVDHKTRAEAAHEADAVAARAHALGFEAYVVPAVLTATRGDEGALRDARFAALEELARDEGLSALVVAHHQDDVAEGALLSWLGDGGGALAVEARRGSLVVVRPFLALSRAQLALARTALSAHGAFADPDHHSARARLRHDVLAALPDRAAVTARMAAQAHRRASDEATLLDLARGAIVHEGTRVVVRTDAPALLRRALRSALADLLRHRRIDPRDSSRAVDTIVRLVEKRQNGTVHLAGGIVATVGDAAVQLADGPGAAYASPAPSAPRAEEDLEEDS